MIVGLGTDIVEVQRLKASLDRYGERFLCRVFTAGEQAYCAAKRHPEESLAARFAAKEAAAKALGTGISQGVGWQDFEVSREPGHAPRLQLNGRALALASALGVAHISLSMTHTAALASATVILESD
jgi:holo-[acyl-carrier protein] synthase